MVFFPISGRIYGVSPTLRLGQDRAGEPAPPFPDCSGKFQAQAETAEATSIDTPGPMVELIETFFM